MVINSRFLWSKMINKIFNHWISDNKELHDAWCWKYHASCAFIILKHEIEHLNKDIENLRKQLDDKSISD